MPNSYTKPVSAADITAAGGALESTRAAADAALAAPSYVCLATTSTLSNERVLTGTSNQITLTDNGAGGTLVLSTPQNIHTGAAPTFAGETLTQALTMAGTQTALGASATGFYRDSSGNLNSNVATGATHIARVNGNRVGGFPLQPGDMPAKNEFKAQVTTGQTITTSLGKLNLDTAAVNDCFTVSSSVLTCTVAGEYYYEVVLIGTSANNVQLELDVSGSRNNPGVPSSAQYGFRLTGSTKLAVGDTVTLKGITQTGSTTIDTASYAFYRNFRLVRML